MAEKHGNLSINSDNLFPIIKKWLYSDHDIFYRELVSNGCDAITKYRMTNPDDESEMSVMVTVDKENKTLTIDLAKKTKGGKWIAGNKYLYNLLYTNSELEMKVTVMQWDGGHGGTAEFN